MHRPLRTGFNPPTSSSTGSSAGKEGVLRALAEPVTSPDTLRVASEVDKGVGPR